MEKRGGGFLGLSTFHHWPLGLLMGQSTLGLSSYLLHMQLDLLTLEGTIGYEEGLERASLHLYQWGLLILEYGELGALFLNVQPPLYPAENSSNWGNR